MNHSERMHRLLARQRAKAVLEPLRRLVATLSEWERLDDADAIGVVRIRPGETEADYGPAVLDLAAQAVSEQGAGRVIEVFVTSSPQQPIHRARPRGAVNVSERKQSRV